MKKIIFLIDHSIADYYIETILSIAKFLKPATYEIRDYKNLKHLSIHGNGENNNIFYNFCADHPLKDSIFKILSKRRLINPLESQKICFNKTESDMLLRRFGLPAPAAICTINPEEVKRFISSHSKVIFKEKESCSGSGHFIADEKYAFVGNEKLILRITDKQESQDLNVKIKRNSLICGPPFYVQSFLKPDDPEVWRIYVVNGEIVFFSKRYRDKITNEKDYVINAAKGAKYSLKDKMPVIDHYTDKIRDMMADLKLRVATIDFIIHKGQAYFLEIDCDGIYTFICRGFRDAENYTENYDLDSYIAKMLIDQLA